MDDNVSRNAVQWKDFMSTVMNIEVNRNRQFRHQLDNYPISVQRTTSSSHYIIFAPLLCVHLKECVSGLLVSPTFSPVSTVENLSLEQ